MFTRLISGLAMLLVVVSTTVCSQAADDQGFTKLFNGKNLDGFKVVPATAAPAFRVKDGVIVVSGRPPGYLCTKKSFKNFVLRFDWRYKRPAGLTDDASFGGNSGLLVHIQSTQHQGTWPKCIEVQGMNRQHGRIFAIGGAKGRFKTFTDVQKAAIRPVGQWNTTEVTSMNGKLTAKVNGKLVSEGIGELTEGFLGWQSEGAEIHFRNIVIKELK